MLSTSATLLQADGPFLGVKYSPCNTKFLACSCDSKIFAFNAPKQTETEKCVKDNVWKNPGVNDTCVIKEPNGRIYDFSWYPFTRTNLKESYVFLSTGSGLPIHLWDANDGSLKASYCGVNEHTQDHMSAISLSFSTNGNHIVSKFSKASKVESQTR